MAKGIYIGVGSKARKIKKAYIGVTENIYKGESENDGSGEFFFGYGGADLTAGACTVKLNGVSYSGFNAAFYPEEGWNISNGEITVKIEAPIQGQDGSVYIYDMDGKFADVSSISLQIIKGKENIARRVKKVYIGDANGKARLCYSAT